MSGVILGIVIVVIIFVVCAAIYFIGKWIRDGAEVAPLSEKELFKVNRKRGYLTELNKGNKTDALNNLNTEGKEVTSVYNQNQQDENQVNYNFDYIKYDKYNEEDEQEIENDSDIDDEDSNLDMEDEDYDDERED